MAEGGGGGGMKTSTILLIVVVLWFLSTQIGKITGSLNRTSTAVNNASKPLQDVGGAAASLINAGASALGRWGTGSSAPATDYTNDPDIYRGSSTTQGIDPSTGGVFLPAGDVYGPPAPSASWSDDGLAPTPDWAA